MISWVLAAALAAAAAPPASIACEQAGRGEDSFCAASDRTRLHLVDWGGEGPPIVLLAGLGNSARIFDELAPLLAKDHRVVALTRRGYGLSADAATGEYGNERLVQDVIDVLDGLGIERAAFVGHSLAGGELATLGRAHPGRVTRLVYLDAAYDRSPVPQIMAGLPAIPGPSAADLASLQAMAAWRAGALHATSPAIASDLADVMRPGARGLVPRTAPEVAQRILAGDIAAPPAYGEIAAPSLALYTSKDVAEQVPADADPQVDRDVIAYSIKHIRPWMLRSQATFLEDQACGVAFEVPRSGHYLFLESAAWTARTILAFLDTTQPCVFEVARPGASED